MSTLRAFQTEIQQIARQHQQQPTTSVAVQVQTKRSKPGAEASLSTSSPQPVIQRLEKTNYLDDTWDQVDSLQSLLVDPSAASQIRDALAQVLLRNKGELVLRLGRHPNVGALWAAGDAGADIEDARGTPLSYEEHEICITQLNAAIEDIGGFITTLVNSKAPYRSTHLIRLPPTSVESVIEVRCAVVGNVDSGKSTTLGVLTRGALDDGRGKARIGLFRHKHEIESGRTSSVGMEILGFSPAGLPILPSFHAGTSEALHGYDKLSFAPTTARREKIGWDEISSQSAKVVSFIDLAGHERYLKTSLFGMTSGAPDCVLLMVGGNAGMIGMSKEHLAIALALSVPVVVAITKIDMTPENVLEETKKQVMKILKSPGCRKTPVFVKNLETAVEISQAFTREKICPIFMLSNVTGEGLDLFRTFLNLCPSSEGDQEKYPIDQPLEYSVTEVWSVPHVGTVVNGLIASGRVHAGDSILFGPDSNGAYQNSVVKSIQRKRSPVGSAEAGQCVSLALKRVRRAAIRKGMVIVHKSETPPTAVRRFEGQVLILYHNSTLQKNYQAMLHCGAIRQTVRILSMDNPQGILRTGDKATVEFEFITAPEFIKPGMKLLFREGKTKGLGVVTKLLP